MREITTLTFTDDKSQSEGVLIIRASKKKKSHCACRY